MPEHTGRCEWGAPGTPCFEKAIARIYTSGDGYRACQQHYRDARRWRIQHMGAEGTHVQRFVTCLPKETTHA